MKGAGLFLMKETGQGGGGLKSLHFIGADFLRVISLKQTNKQTYPIK